MRETIESIVVAVILAFLFRGFVAEAFVIPTGSMAPTLRGRHMDIVCPKCEYQYMTGASMENRESGQMLGEVRETTCPICHFPLELEKDRYPNDRSFNGDRILVSKFAYQVGEPRRWDVIVFKYPGNAKQNYIKRLVGLPGERLRIQYGDVHALESVNGREQARILRKEPTRLRSMLQLVDDTDHVAADLIAAKCPPRWQQASSVAAAEQWQASEDWSQHSVAAGAEPSWMRYRHLAPHRREWQDEIARQVAPQRLLEIPGELITDHYSYNDSSTYGDDRGTVWVGDLAVEGRVDIQSDAGELLLDLVEGGAHHECRIDIATGQATLSMREFDGRARPFVDDAGVAASPKPVGGTSIRGRGKHRLRFSNCDDQLLLWVDDQVVRFDGPTTYVSPPNVTPKWSPEDPGDIAPVGVGAQNAAVTVSSLRVLRDIYYLAHRPGPTASDQSEYDVTAGEFHFRELMSRPDQWEQTDLFASRHKIEFELGEDQFFPLGDNSPQSKDARLWYEGPDLPPYVERELLIGKALLVYWPHGWRPPWPWLSGLTANVAFIPNFAQMKLIR